VKRRSLTLLLLLGGVILVIAAGVLVAWHPWTARATASGQDAAPPASAFVQLSQVSQDLLRTIDLTSITGTITLDDASGKWRIVKPAVLDVKKAPMDDLLYSIANLASERVIEEKPADLTIYGLQPPQVTVRLTLTTGEVRELYLGDLTPAGDSYYLMEQGDSRVFTVRAHHGTYFHYVIRDLWDGAFTPLDGTSIASITLRRAGKLVVQLKQTPALLANDIEFRGTKMSVVYPYVNDPRPADSGFINSFAQALASLQSTYAVDAGPQSLAKYGLDAPVAELEMSDQAGKSVHVYAGKSDGQVLYLKFEKDPTVYAGDPSLLAILSSSATAFVSKYAAIVRLDDIDSLTFDAAGARHVLAVKRATAGSEVGATWLVDGKSVPEKSFKNFYVAAVSLQSDTLFQGGPPAGAAEVTMTFGLIRGTAKTFTVRFVPYNADFFAVVKNGKSDMLVNRQQVTYVLDLLNALVAAAKQGS
jgi:hypothetical protein